MSSVVSALFMRAEMSRVEKVGKRRESADADNLIVDPFSLRGTSGTALQLSEALAPFHR